MREHIKEKTQLFKNLFFFPIGDFSSSFFSVIEFDGYDIQGASTRPTPEIFIPYPFVRVNSTSGKKVQLSALNLATEKY